MTSSVVSADVGDLIPIANATGKELRGFLNLSGGAVAVTILSGEVSHAITIPDGQQVSAKCTVVSGGTGLLVYPA